jgi:hypothetical protein
MNSLLTKVIVFRLWIVTAIVFSSVFAQASYRNVAISVQCKDDGPIYKGTLFLFGQDDFVCRTDNHGFSQYAPPIYIQFNSLRYRVDQPSIWFKSPNCDMRSLRYMHDKAVEQTSHRVVPFNLDPNETSTGYFGKIGHCSFQTM